MRINQEKIKLLKEGKVIIYNDRSDKSVRLLKEITYFINNQKALGTSLYYYVEHDIAWAGTDNGSHPNVKGIRQHLPSWFFEEEINNSIILLL